MSLEVCRSPATSAHPAPRTLPTRGGGVDAEILSPSRPDRKQQALPETLLVEEVLAGPLGWGRHRPRAGPE